MILKDFQIESLGQAVQNNICAINFKATNPSFATVEVLNIDFFDKNKNKIPKKSMNIPCSVERGKSKNISLFMPLNEYKSMEVS